MGFELCQCVSCGHRYATETFNSSTLAEDYYEEPESALDRRSTTAKSERYANEYAKLLSKHFGRRGRVLDIGCNSGELLALFKQDGWDIEGIEMSAAPAQYAKSKLNCPIWVGSVEQVLPTLERFDLVTMTHVLEHIANPTGLLLRLRDILAPTGALLLEVPNADDWLLPIWGGCYRPLCPGDHVSFFDRNSLALTLERSGFAVLEIATPMHAHDILYGGILSTMDALRALRSGKSQGRGPQGVLSQVRYRGRWRKPLRTLLDFAVHGVDPLAVSVASRIAPNRGTALVVLARPTQAHATNSFVT